jgi:acyl-CoA synthetase (NDP forming)
MSGHKEDWFAMREVEDLPVFVNIDEALTAMRRSYAHFKNRSGVSDGLSHIAKYKTTNASKSRLPGGIMPAGETFDLVRAYGLDVADFKIVRNAEEGIQYARTIGYPLSLKIVSPYILHKTEEQAVFLNIKNENDLKKTFQSRKADSYLVQKMIPPGCEIIIGGRRDPEFGPVILCGLGGIFVEVYKDVAVRVAPINDEIAGQMLEEVKGTVILNGFRGQGPYDIEHLTSSLVKVSKLLMEHPEIEVLDINPLILQEKGNGGVVVDVKLQVS